MSLRTIRLFISSPGDVAEERLIARRLIGRLDAQFGGALQFEAILWERAPLVASASFQEQLVRPSDTDVVIVILWSRLGTPLPTSITRADGTTYASGTEFEFEDAILSYRRDGHPRVLTYFKTAPITPSGDLESLEEATHQKRAMDRFVRAWFRNADGTLSGAFHNFAAPADFEDLLEAHLTQLAEEFIPPGVAVHGNAPTWRGRSPFRGLQVFEPEHAPVFFGRTAAAATVLAKLRAQGHAGRAFVLIVSMSGAGKSSLIRAGVLPLLLQPGVVGTATIWRHAVMRPGDGQGRLVAPLVQAVLRATAIDLTTDDADGDRPIPSAEELVAIVSRRLARIARALVDDDEPASCHLAFVIDQLEEIFSDDRVAVEERNAFFIAVDALARSGVVWIVSSMRSDSYFRMADAPTLVALKEGEGQFDLLPPSLREIGQIIRLPAAAAGLRFESRPNTAEKLDDVIRDASARNPGALPLLQFLLEELYQRRNAEDVLTFKAYDDLGGVEGALANHAEAVLASVSEAARQSLGSVLWELVTFDVDDESRALRRVAPLDAFTAAPSIELIEALLEARLLVSGSADDGLAMVSLAHEALLEFWPRMKTWVEQDRQLLLVHARLGAATREWDRNGRRPDLLLPRGKPLAEAKEVAAAGIRLSESENALLAASQRRARTFAIARAGAISGLVVLTVVAGVAAYRARVESSRAQVQATTAQRTTDFMVGLFANADPNQNKGDKVTVREVLDRGVIQIESGLSGEASVRANLLRAMGQSYSGLGLYPKAHDVLSKAVAQSEQGGNAEDLLRARIVLADNDYQNGDYSAAESTYRTALEQARRLNGDQSDSVAQITSGLAETLADDNQSQAANDLYQAALKINVQLHGSQSIEAARDLDGMGRLSLYAGRLQDAKSQLEDSLMIRRTLLGPRDTSVATSMSNLANVYYQLGDLDKAVSASLEVLVLYRELFGPDHPRTALVLNNLGRMELIDDQLVPAKQHLQQSLSIFRKTLSPTHDELIPPLNSLAMIDLVEGALDQAGLKLDEALSITRTRHHWMLNQVLGNKAIWLALKGQVPQARESLAEARGSLQQLYGAKLESSDRWRSAILDLSEAECDFAVGDVAKARKLVSAAFTPLQNQFGRKNFYLEAAERLTLKMSAK